MQLAVRLRFLAIVVALIACAHIAAGAGPLGPCRMRLPSCGRNPSIFWSAIFSTAPEAARLRRRQPTGRLSFSPSRQPAPTLVMT